MANWVQKGAAWLQTLKTKAEVVDKTKEKKNKKKELY